MAKLIMCFDLFPRHRIITKKLYWAGDKSVVSYSPRHFAPDGVFKPKSLNKNLFNYRELEIREPSFIKPLFHVIY